MTEFKEIRFQPQDMATSPKDRNILAFIKGSTITVSGGWYTVYWQPAHEDWYMPDFECYCRPTAWAEISDMTPQPASKKGER